MGLMGDRSMHLSVASKRPVMIALLVALASCNLVGPGTGPFPNAGNVLVRIENLSGYPAAVDTRFQLIGLEVRRTVLRLAASGPESAEDLLWTTTDTISLSAVVDEGFSPASSSQLNPGDTLDKRELRFGADFEDGAQLLITISPPPAPPQPPPPKPTPPLTHDCNNNRVEDATDIAGGSSRDCNRNDVPDECEPCPGLDVVFVWDTSRSLANEAQGLCQTIAATTQQLHDAGLLVRSANLGVKSRGGPEFACLTDTVANLLGGVVPGEPPCCPPIDVEDWGPATAIVAARYPWEPGAIRMIVPISDEGPVGGDPCRDPGDDRDSITLALGLAAANQVIVSPIVAQGTQDQMPCVRSLALDLATGTGGVSIDSLAAPVQLPLATTILHAAACERFRNCTP